MQNEWVDLIGSRSDNRESAVSEHATDAGHWIVLSNNSILARKLCWMD